MVVVVVVRTFFHVNKKIQKNCNVLWEMKMMWAGLHVRQQNSTPEILKHHHQVKSLILSDVLVDGRL